MKKQTLTYYPIMSMQDIDFKIKDVGKYWQYVTVESITYHGGAYTIRLNVEGVKND